MILRKPFAILIKYFKLIHAILTVLSFYLLYRTNLIMSFFSEYMKTNNSVIGKNLTGELYTILMYVSLFIIIIGIIIIMGLMIFKQKKIKLYIFNIFTYIFVVVVYAIAYSVLSSLEIELVDVRTLKMVQDLFTTIFALQIVSFFSLAMRATGFDIKKFDFKKDLQELEIEENDNEEFEVNVDLSSDETKRKFNRAVRHAKYIYRENKYVLWLLLGIIVAIASTAIYMNINVYNKTYSKNEAFAVTYFTLSLSDAYSSSLDYKGNKILSDEESLVMVKLKIKNNTIKERQFESARLALKVDEHYFHHDVSYDEKVIDVGTAYNKQNINSEFTEYLFIFKIPTNFLHNKLTLIYSDYNNKDVKINVNLIDLDKNEEIKDYNLNEIINFENSVLDNVKLKLESVEMADYFKVDYNYCISEEQCYPSYEYVFPYVNSNNRKILLKIVGNFEENATGNYKNIYSFIRDYGTLEYEIDGQTKKIDLTTQIKPAKSSKNNEIYIETIDEVKYAERIKITFKIRNKTYKYIIK